MSHLQILSGGLRLALVLDGVHCAPLLLCFYYLQTLVLQQRSITAAATARPLLSVLPLRCLCPHRRLLDGSEQAWTQLSTSCVNTVQMRLRTGPRATC